MDVITRCIYSWWCELITKLSNWQKCLYNENISLYSIFLSPRPSVNLSLSLSLYFCLSVSLSAFLPWSLKFFLKWQRLRYFFASQGLCVCTPDSLYTCFFSWLSSHFYLLSIFLLRHILLNVYIDTYDTVSMYLEMFQVWTQVFWLCVRTIGKPSFYKNMCNKEIWCSHWAPFQTDSKIKWPCTMYLMHITIMV
jgi:hypothetical protein